MPPTGGAGSGGAGSGGTGSGSGPGQARSDEIQAHRAARRLVLASLFEAEFGQRTATAILERHLADTAAEPAVAEFARQLVAAVVAERDQIDRLIERLAPQYPVVQLARMDRSLLRAGIGEVLHSATPPRVAVAEWVELSRAFSGEPARRLVNGVLGRITRGPRAGVAVVPEAIASQAVSPPDGSISEEGVSGHHLRSSQEDRRRAARRRRG